MYKMFYKTPMIERNKPLIGLTIACGSGAASIGRACRLVIQGPCARKCRVGTMRPGSMCRLDVVVLPGDENVAVTLNTVVFRSLVGGDGTGSLGADAYERNIVELKGAIVRHEAFRARRLVFSVYPSEPGSGSGGIPSGSGSVEVDPGPEPRPRQCVVS